MPDFLIGGFPDHFPAQSNIEYIYIWEEPVRMWKGNKVGLLPSILWVFLTIYIFCFNEIYHVFEASRGESYYVMW